MAVPPNSDLPRLCASPEFTNLVERVKRELQVSITPNFKVLGASNGAASSSTPEMPAEYSFKFRCQRSNSDFLITAREMLEQFLLNHNVHVYPSPTSHSHKRGDSFAEAFPHFDSKVLSTAKTRGHGKCSQLCQRVVSHVRSTQNLWIWVARKLSGIGGSDSPIHLQMSKLFSTHRPTSTTSTTVQIPAIWPVLYRTIGLHWLLSYVFSVTSRRPSFDCKQGSGIPSRTKHTDDALKRGSDSLLEAKLKEQIGKPRSLTNRAQSLDLTKSFSRLTGDSSSSMLPPESPTTSTGDTGGNSSPTSVSFPSVYDPTMSSRTAVIGSSAQLGSAADVEDIDEVSRVISNLGL
jgi:hypothetical protein